MQLQLIYDEIAEKKRDEKDLKKMYKDALDNSNEYCEVVELIKTLTEKKKGIETIIRTNLGKVWEELEEIKEELTEKKITMTDLAMNDLMSGKTVRVEKDGVEYEPVWSVKFKRIS